jgi:hypothetical protein
MSETQTGIIDYIQDEILIKNTFHGEFIYLYGNGYVELYKTNDLQGVNPITNQALNEVEQNFITLYRTVLLHLSSEVIQPYINEYADLRQWTPFYNISSRSEYRNLINMLDFYLEPSMLQTNFKTFEPTDANMIKYERHGAENILRHTNRPGKWLLRHSSENRPQTSEKMLQNSNAGIKYYVISFTDNERQITHHLFSHHIGRGWRIASQNQWFTSFLRCLERLLQNYQLSYSEQISHYVMDFDLP